MNTGGKFSDEELMEAIQKNERKNDAIRYLYQEYFDSLSSLITYNSGSPEDAQDIFQEVIVSFVQIVQDGKFRGESSIKTFLYALARNTWLNELKRRGRMNQRNKLYEEGRDSVTIPASESFENREIRKQLLASVGRLGEDCRRILTLFYYEGLSMKEILEQTAYENDQVVRNKKYKCLKQLADLINNDKIIAENLKQIDHEQGF
jgi:RNA polymerase sigma factor (sigma-70 family)